MADYIEREAFLKSVLTAGIGKTIVEYSESDIGYMIRRQPAADVAPVVHGQWVYEYGDEFSETYKCSVCGHREEICVEMFRELLPCYCPSCGAKMQGGAIDGVDQC